MYSLVTACMNREPHLRASLQRWLMLPRIAEIVIVDWGNREPLLELRNIDPRIRIVRVENEPRWVLSYAYNAGIERATQPDVFKCDADCQPAPAALECTPGSTHFFAGFWKSGVACGKASVNGQCIFSKAQFEAVNGYSELIRTYGRDDEDFYDRLISAGFERRELHPALLSFIEHSNASRVANQFEMRPGVSFEDVIRSNTTYNEIQNYCIGKLIPWGPQRRRADFFRIDSGDRWEVLRRNQAAELSIPPDVAAAARLFSLRHLAGRILNISATDQQRLDEKSCLSLLAEHIKQAAH
jgi:glycosyltransferase involved in cell wall biosynthesis